MIESTSKPGATEGCAASTGYPIKTGTRDIHMMLDDLGQFSDSNARKILQTTLRNLAMEADREGSVDVDDMEEFLNIAAKGELIRRNSDNAPTLPQGGKESHA